jgi:hypothetical protein
MENESTTSYSEPPPLQNDSIRIMDSTPSPSSERILAANTPLSLEKRRQLSPAKTSSPEKQKSIKRSPFKSKRAKVDLQIAAMEQEIKDSKRTQELNDVKEDMKEVKAEFRQSNQNLQNQLNQMSSQLQGFQQMMMMMMMSNADKAKDKQ